MTDRNDTQTVARTPVATQSASRMKFQGIIEADAEDHPPAPASSNAAKDDTAPVDRDQPMVAIPLGAGDRNWNALSRQVWQASRLFSIMIFFALVAGWPVGAYWSHISIYGVSAGWLTTLRGMLDPGVVVFAFLTPILLSLCGYFLSHAYKMLYAAESIASAAQQFLNPAQNAADSANSVGAAVRSQLDALNTGIDGALQRLAGVESMIRQHVEVIETAGDAIQTRTSGVIDKVATERSRLIDLTESLNIEADAFAAAIAERAQTSIESLNQASNLSETSESRFEERIAHLEAAAAKALSSFEALRTAIDEADSHMRGAAVTFEESSEKTRVAGDAAAKTAEAVAASVEENAKALQSSTKTVADAIKQVADDTIQNASKDAERIVEETSKALGDVNDLAKAAINQAADQAASANESAKALSQSASQTAQAAAKVSSDIVKSNEDTKKAAEEAAQQAQETAAQIEARSQALTEARRALEAENARLEALINEQRKRADRLANAIAAQTDRLSKLAESQLQEQAAAEASQQTMQSEPTARSHPTPSTNQEDAPPPNVTPFSSRIRVDYNKKTPKPERPNEEQKTPRPNFSAEKQARNHPTDRSAEAPALQNKQAKLDKGQPFGGNTNEPPKRGPKDDVSWREILSATDEAAPLDLQKGPPPGQSAAFAMNIISNLQDFTMSLETRLYGDPPRALLERFERGDRNVFANRLLRLNEADVKRRIRMESGRDKNFEKSIHEFLQGFERLLEDATTSETADEELEEYLSSSLGRVYLLIGATVGYFA